MSLSLRNEIPNSQDIKNVLAEGAHYKVLFLSARSDVGGGQRVMFDTVLWLMNRKAEEYRIHVCCPEEWPYFDRYELMARVGLIELVPLPLRLLHLNNLFILYRLVRQNQIEVVVSHGKGAGFWSRLLHLTTGVPVIHYFHGIHVPAQLGMRDRLYVVAERLLGGLTEVQVCVSDSERSRALALGIANPHKTIVIPNGVDTSRFRPCSPAERADLRSRLGLTSSFIVTTVGRLAAVKNLPFAIDVIAHYRRCIGDIQLAVVGGNDDLSIDDLQQVALRAGAEGSVVFFGEANDVTPYYHAADVYLGTSLWEGLPSTVLEAQACGLPAVLTNVVGNMSAVRHGETGYLVPPGSIDGFVSVLRRLATDDALRKKMGQAAREFVKACFVIDTSCISLTQLIDKCRRESNT